MTIKQLKDWLKEAVAPAARSKDEKPSIMAQLNQSKKEIKEIKNTGPSALTELRAKFNTAYENLKRVDRRLKSANGVDEYDKIIIERRKAYNEYSVLKTEVKLVQLFPYHANISIDAASHCFVIAEYTLTHILQPAYRSAVLEINQFKLK